jgi:hypothetical protein
MTDEQTTETAPAVRPRVVSEALTGQTPGARVAATPVPVLHSSDTVVDIITALCAAQGKFGVVAKDRTANVEMRGGGSYKYSYATLASVIAAVRPALNEQGIALVQSANIVNTERSVLLQVDTRFLHTSGQWIGSVLRLPLGDATPQGMGSLLTYLRRYGLSALAGVASEDDDDGQLAQTTPPPARESRPRATRPQPARASQDIGDPAGDPPPPSDPPPQLENELPTSSTPRARGRATKPASTAPPKTDVPVGSGGITARDRALLFKTAKDCAWAEADVKSLIKQLYNYDSTSQLTPEQLTRVLQCIEFPGDNGVTFETMDGATVVVVKAEARG